MHRDVVMRWLYGSFVNSPSLGHTVIYFIGNVPLLFMSGTAALNGCPLQKRSSSFPTRHQYGLLSVQSPEIRRHHNVPRLEPQSGIINWLTFFTTLYMANEVETGIN